MVSQTKLKVRHCVIKLILDSGSFPSGDEDNPAIKTIYSNSDNNSLAIEALISKQEGFMANRADIRITGMNKSDIEAFSRFKMYVNTPVASNYVEVYAGYDLNSDGLPPFIYKGTVLTAYPDYNDPNRPFIIASLTGFSTQNATAKAVNLKGTITLDDLLRNIISNYGGFSYRPYMRFDTVVRNANYDGSLDEQLDKICKHYGLIHKQSDDGRSILVTKIGMPYLQEQLTISSDNYLLGYPIVMDTAIMLKVRFTPAIQFGQKLSIKSYMSLANGDNWYINSIVHHLQTQGDSWESILVVQSFPTGVQNG